MKNNPSTKITTLGNFKLFLNKLSEDEGNTILSAAEIDSAGVTVKNTRWSRIDINTPKIRPEFSLYLQENYNLTDITIKNPDAFKSAKIQIYDCPNISKKSLKVLNYLYSVSKYFHRGSVIPLYNGTCLYEELPDLALPECKLWMGDIKFSKASQPKLPAKELKLDHDSCISIVNTDLVSIAFIRYQNKSLANPKCTGNRAEIRNNKKLCLSPRDVLELKTVFPHLVIEDNDEKCQFVCKSADFVAGKLKQKKCHILKGPVVLEGDFLPDGVDLSQVMEIREGGLRIAHTTKNYWSQFKSLMSIDNSESALALEITNTTIKTLNLMYLSRIVETSPGTRLIKLRNNKQLKLTKSTEETLKTLAGAKVFDGIVEIVEVTPPVITTTVISITTNEDDSDDEDDDDDDGNVTREEFAEKTSTVTSMTVEYITSPADGTKLSIIIIIIILGVSIGAATVVYGYIRWRRFKMLPLPRGPFLPKSKKELVHGLMDEILEMNPLEWRMATQNEATQPKPSKERENFVNKIREQYQLFISAVHGHVAFTVRPPPDTNSFEIFKMFKKFYEDTQAQGQMILLSKTKDPEVSIPLLSMKVGAVRTIKGDRPEPTDTTQKITSKTESTSKELPESKTNFEISATLILQKEYNSDIDMYIYKVAMNQGAKLENDRWEKNFYLELIHYHNWTEGGKDFRTILQLIEYGRTKKPYEKRPTFVTCSSSQSFTVMMLTAIVYHLTQEDFPYITIRDAKALISEMTDCSYPDTTWFVFLLWVTVAWAKKDKAIPLDKKQACEDFCHIYEKMAKYIKAHPNNFFYNAKDLGLRPEVLIRVENSQVLEKLSKEEQESPHAYPTISVMDFKKDSDSDQPSSVSINKQSINNEKRSSTEPQVITMC